MNRVCCNVVMICHLWEVCVWDLKDSSQNICNWCKNDITIRLSYIRYKILRLYTRSQQNPMYIKILMFLVMAELRVWKHSFSIREMVCGTVQTSNWITLPLIHLQPVIYAICESVYRNMKIHIAPVLPQV